MAVILKFKSACNNSVNLNFDKQGLIDISFFATCSTFGALSDYTNTKNLIFKKINQLPK